MKYILLSAILILAACRPNKPQPKPEPEPKFVHPSYLTINGITDTITHIYWHEGGRSPSSALSGRADTSFNIGFSLGYFPRTIPIKIVNSTREGVLECVFYLSDFRNIDKGDYTYFFINPAIDSIVHLYAAEQPNGKALYKLYPTKMLNQIRNSDGTIRGWGTDTILVSGEFYVPEGEYEE